jgi:hypothetical protein
MHQLLMHRLDNPPQIGGAAHGPPETPELVLYELKALWILLRWLLPP